MKMGIIKQTLITLEDDFEAYQRHRPSRSMEELMVSESKTEIKYMGNSVHYVKGDTLDPQFWREVRNAIIKEQGYNDDREFDEESFNLQKELIGHGIVGKIAIALIGTDTTKKGISEHMGNAVLNDYTPIIWNWCGDCWCINDRVINSLNKRF